MAGDGEPASAAVILVINPSESPEILFIKRRISERDPWSGQVALPGGRYRSEDGELSETIRRELYEEVGLRLGEDVELAGSIQPLTPSNVPSLKVRPYVGILRREAEIVVGDELAGYFWTPLKNLRRRVGPVYAGGGRWLRNVFYYQAGSEAVWGLTANILNRLLLHLEPLG
ncbi:putative Nudix hydrolase NudL [archaeon HR01]|nr:putative Nudix hydrolase NudL [archaeon HR01]